MPTGWSSLRTAGRPWGIARRGLLLSPIAGGWVMVYLAAALEDPGRVNPALLERGLGWSLLLSAAAAGGLAVFGLGLNDLLDFRRDRLLDRAGEDGVAREARPRAEFAKPLWIWTFGALVLALVAAAGLGRWSWALTAAVGVSVLFYNVAGRFVPAVGIVTLGLAQGLAMAIPNPWAAFAWPVLLTVTHVITAGTLERLAEPPAGRRRSSEVAGILMGWGFWCLVILVLIGQRGGGDVMPPTIWIGPAVAVLGYGVWAGRLLRQARATQGAERGEVASSLRRLGLQWLLVYDLAWLLSAGLWWPAASIAGLMLLLRIGLRTRPEAGGSPQK